MSNAVLLALAASSMLLRLVLHMQDQCAFNGAWGGGNRHPTAFYVSSYFWDRATDAGIITDENALTWDLKPSDLIDAATKACGTPVSGLAAAFPQVLLTFLPFPSYPLFEGALVTGLCGEIFRVSARSVLLHGPYEMGCLPAGQGRSSAIPLPRSFVSVHSADDRIQDP